MWFKISYSGGAVGTSDALDMTDAFSDFYENEKIEHPEDAKGLAMFQHPFSEYGGTLYFHTSCIFHQAFFIKHGCSLCPKPQSLPPCIKGDCKYFS